METGLAMLGALAALGAYLLGSVSFAILVSRLAGLPDPRTYGSGNPGATNVLRTGKRAIAVLTLAGDAGKGWLAVWLASIFVPQAVPVAGVAVKAGARSVFATPSRRVELYGDTWLAHGYPALPDYEAPLVSPPGSESENPPIGERVLSGAK